MPYPNEHACRIRSPGDFQKGSFRRIKRGSKTGGGARDGKQLSIIIGRPQGKTTTATQAFRYPKDDWTEAQARAHCKEEGGTFEAATGQEESESIVVGNEVLFREDLMALQTCLIAEVIRKEGDEIILYDSEGEKVLGRFPFGEGRKYKDEGAAREAAKKREREIQFFKHKETDVDVDKFRSLLQETLDMLGQQQIEPIEEDEIAEAQFSESASGHAIALAETQAVTGGPRAPLLMDVALIKPGWGNRKDNHYYPREVLARDAKVFEGVKMYATDHRAGEKNVKTEVSVVRQITGFTDDGAPIAQVAVHDPDFAEATRNRAKLGTLDTLECSILATGRTKKGEAPDGEKGNIVEAITRGTSVDWVTKAGAGGHAIALAESNTGGDNMADEKEVITEEQEEASREATLAEGGGVEAITYLAESEVREVLEASRLPRQAQGRLAEGRYLDAEALKAAIEQERQYVKELTGSGKPFAQGGGTAPGEEQMSEADYDAAYADILTRHGVYVPQQQEVA